MTVVLLVILVIEGLILAVTPWLIKRSEVFAVTIPSAEYNHPRLRLLRRLYVVIMSTTTVLLVIVLIALAILASMDDFFIVYSIACFMIILVAIPAYLICRSQALRLKATENWALLAGDQVSAVTSTITVKDPPAMAWNLLYIVVLLITIVIQIVLYPQMPDQLVMQIDLDGTVTSTIQKSPASMLFAPLVQAFMASCMVFAYWMMCRGRLDINPSYPFASAHRSALFVRIQALVLLFFGVLTCAAITLIPFTFVGWLPLQTAGLIMMAVIVMMLVAELYIALKYGQFGARLAPSAEAESSIARDDDRYWRLGMFYFNPNDPVLFLPKRFGVGWTSNFARPLVWLFIIGLVLLTTAFVAAVFLLV